MSEPFPSLDIIVGNTTTAMVTLESLIKERIRREGPIPFARFMEMALYIPSLGYYTSGKERVGPQGDFYTSPAVHPAFGALIALALEGMWRLLGSLSPFTVVEMGAGKGNLARDVLAFSRYLSPDFTSALNYVTVDHGESLPSGVVGCILSNELLDAFPVHRVAVQEGQLKEVYVDLGRPAEALVEIMGPPSTPLLSQRLEEEGVTLAEGQQGEINLGLEPWAQRVAAALDKGYVLTVDYGHEAPELYAPRRPRGTFLCYWHHMTSENPYLQVGERDMTAHVDFTALLRASQKAGLERCGLVSQREFLEGLGLGLFSEVLTRLGLSPRDRQANLLALEELARPGGMGDFKVLLQAKGVKACRMEDLYPGPERVREALAQEGALPLLAPQPVPLLQARYPYLAGDPELWGELEGPEGDEPLG